MSGLVWVGFLAFFVVALVVGVRVLLLARRTRELPELLMGIGVLGIGPVGFGLMVVAQQVPSSPGLEATLLGLGTLAVCAGTLAKLVFNWRVYHADGKVVRVIVALGAGTLLLCYVWAGVGYRFSLDASTSPPYLGRSLLTITCLLWGSGESFAYWMKMRRRVRLGLADPVVANRFLMWAIGAFAAGFGSAVGTVAQLVSGIAVTQGGWVMVSSSLHGLVAAIAIALAFIPPAFWVRYIRSRAERIPAAG